MCLSKEKQVRRPVRSAIPRWVSKWPVHHVHFAATWGTPDIHPGPLYRPDNSIKCFASNSLWEEGKQGSRGSILVRQVHHLPPTKEAAKSNDETSLPLFSTSHWRTLKRERHLASPSLSSTLLSCLFDQAAPENRSRFLLPVQARTRLEMAVCPVAGRRA